MPDFIVTQTAKEYSDYQKRRAIKARDAFLTGLVILSLSCGFGYYTLWGMVNH